MKKIIYVLSLAMLSLSITSCSSDKPTASKTDTKAPSIVETTTPNEEISYSVQVVDLDGEVLANKEIKTKDPKSLTADLKANFDFKFSVGDYGTTVISINNSVVDPNYFLALYQNGEMAQTGVDGIDLRDNDKIKFVNTCWNDKLDETDLLIDRVIYKFFKRANELYKDAAYGDYYLAAAISKMRELGYNVNDKLFTEAQASILNEDLSTMKAQDFIKYVSMAKLMNKDLSNAKRALEERTFKPLGKDNTYATFTNAPLYAAAKLAGATLKNKSEYLSWFDDYTIEEGDTGAIASIILADIEDYDLNKFTSVQTKTFTDKGVKTQWGVSGTSTGLMILAFTNLGLDLRASEFMINEDLDLIEVFLNNYLYDGYYFKDSPTDNYYLNGATAQGMASLMAYKIARDNEAKGLGFNKVEIFS